MQCTQLALKMACSPSSELTTHLTGGVYPPDKGLKCLLSHASSNSAHIDLLSSLFTNKEFNFPTFVQLLWNLRSLPDFCMPSLLAQIS